MNKYIQHYITNYDNILQKFAEKPKQNKVANDLKPMGTVAGAIPNKNPDSPEMTKHQDKVYEMQKGVVRARLANDAATAVANKKEMPALKLPVNPPA